MVVPGLSHTERKKHAFSSMIFFPRPSGNPVWRRIVKVNLSLENIAERPLLDEML
jgi:hypothetical protein